ncbi:hypothetical protein [Nocardiopsis nanhaiensis]
MTLTDAIDQILADDAVEVVAQGYEVHLNARSDHGLLVARTLIHRPGGTR